MGGRGGRSTLAVQRLCTIIPFDQVAERKTSLGEKIFGGVADRFEII
ncbi:hypothetical protein PbDSM24746_62940 [Paenibacillus macerans]|nr:hypothetical protein PbDSM24746_62940 [Paenibacillus macerans]